MGGGHCISVTLRFSLDLKRGGMDKGGGTRTAIFT